MFPVLLLITFNLNTVTATITLMSSVDGRQAVCPREVVTYTCTVTQTIELEWIVEPFIPSASRRVTFFVGTHNEQATQSCGDFTSIQCTDIDFQAILTSVAPMMMSIANLTSTFTFPATARLNGRVVQCRGITTGFTIVTKNVTLDVTGPPSPPQTPSHTVHEYRRDNVVLTVLWQPPQDDGGSPVVNYTITVSPGLVPLTTSATNAMVTIPYNVEHTVSIVAANICGNSSAVMETIPAIAGCGAPSRPENGSVQSLDISQSTQEGSEIFFTCNASYVPAGNMASRCASDGMWNPDPATFVCIFDCGSPPAPRNGSLESYTDTTEGSVVFYGCDPGFVPEMRMTSVCTVNGWSPNPGVSTCSVVNCGRPMEPQNGFIEPYQSTLGGAEIFFMCNPRFTPAVRMRSSCTSNSNGVTVDGTWIPDPASHMCNASIIDCGDPSTASSGLVVQRYSSTAVSSVIFYQCQQSGFAPSSSSSVCGEDEGWSPDPSQVVCRMIPTTTPTAVPTVTVNCGVPTTTGNGSVELYQDTTEGAEIFFKCSPGFVPAGRMRAACAGDGRWNPEPAGLRCTASSIVCEAPSFASGVAVKPFNNSKVSSEVFYQCQPGLSIEGRMTSVCDEDGRWSPDPSQLACTTISAAATVAITATVCSLVTFITGVLCGAVATVCISRWNRKGQSSKPANTQEQQQTVPVYEEVDTQSQKIELELKDNVAYGPVKLDSQSQKIELKENVAYGPMKVH